MQVYAATEYKYKLWNNGIIINHLYSLKYGRNENT